MKIPSIEENPIVDREKPNQKYVEWSDKLCEPLKQVVDQIQKLSEALTQEQVRGAEREKAIRHLQGSLDDQQRKLSDVRDALDKEVQLTKQLEEKLSFEKLLKSEVECELVRSRANLAEVKRVNKTLQQELNKDKSLMHETANKLGDREDNAKQKHEVYGELKSESNTLGENDSRIASGNLLNQT